MKLIYSGIYKKYLSNKLNGMSLIQIPLKGKKTPGSQFPQRNVQTGIAITGIKNKWHEIQPHTKLPWYQFEQGFRNCSTNYTFNFQGNSYKQKTGFPMGSPLSPIAADIVMDDLESKCIASLPFQLPFSVHNRGGIIDYLFLMFL